MGGKSSIGHHNDEFDEDTASDDSIIDVLTSRIKTLMWVMVKVPTPFQHSSFLTSSISPFWPSFDMCRRDAMGFILTGLLIAFGGDRRELGNRRVEQLN